jgi:NAD(P)-dependent dehydrogenase (short-subunit alcohol dehydrogenase family)
MSGSAVVTGASRGIGLATACLLAARRMPLALVARSGDALDRVAERLRSSSPVEAVTGDVADPSVTVRAVAAATEHAPLAVFVNNAGVLEPVAPVTELDGPAFRRLLDVNVVGAALGMRAALGATRRRSPLRVVNISSGAAVRAIPGWTAYSASKAALNAMTAVAAVEHAGDVITAIAPGIIETAMQRHIRTLSPQQFPAVADFIGYKADGRLAHPVDASVAIAWLALEAPADLNGKFVAAPELTGRVDAWSEQAGLSDTIARARAWFDALEPS